jgi:hypothetical protein
VLQIYADPLLMVKRQDHPEKPYQVNVGLAIGKAILDFSSNEGAASVASLHIHI